MKGLDLAERYFEEYGLPLLIDHFNADSDRIAAGLVGLGSDCLGFDDELSRDHDWGPGFCLWLSANDYERLSRPLWKAYQSLPKTFSGYARTISEWGEGRVGVFETGTFYRRLLGRSEPPESSTEWLMLHENSLAACTAGRVFYDPFGEFSAFRKKLLAFYPDDVRRVKIAARCMTIGQAGQYNFFRSLWRRDYFAVQYAETKFCADVMSLTFLLNRRYAPYYKWLLRGIEVLPLLGKFLSVQIGNLVATRDYEEKRSLIEEICRAVILALQQEELTDSNSSFLVDHGPAIQAKVADPVLRNRNVWIG